MAILNIRTHPFATKPLNQHSALPVHAGAIQKRLQAIPGTMTSVSSHLLGMASKLLAMASNLASNLEALQV